MDALDALHSSIIEALYHIELTRYSQLCSGSIIIFDHLITLGDEVDLIWNNSWSLGKVLFVVNRYYSLVAVIFNSCGLFARILSDSVCLRYYNWQGWTGVIGCILAEAILQMRLYAIFSLDKRILALMLTCFITSTSISAYILASVLSNIDASAVNLPTGGMFCVPSRVSPTFYLFWIPILSFESLLCFLALIRGFQTLRPGGTSFFSGRHLVITLIRDSVLYFLVICATYVASLIVWILAPVTLYEVPIGFAHAMSCVLANRIVLNIRKAGQVLTESQKQISGQPWSRSRGTLSQHEMSQLRSMRADVQLVKSRTDDSESQTGPWIAIG